MGTSYLVESERRYLIQRADNPNDKSVFRRTAMMLVLIDQLRSLTMIGRERAV